MYSTKVGSCTMKNIIKTVRKCRLTFFRSFLIYRIMKYKEIEEIKKEFYLIGLLQKKAKFECFTDGIFSYYIYGKDKTMHEICIINKKATFMNKEKVVDLLDLEGTFYLCHSIYSPLGTRIARKEFRIVDQDGYIEENLN